MKYNLLKIPLIIFFTSLVLINHSFSEVIKRIEVIGNDRIADDTVILFSEVSLNDNLNEIDLNSVLKKLYKTNFFKKIDLKIVDKILKIDVEENPIIENINFLGVNKKSLLEEIQKNALIKARSSYNEYIVREEKKRIIKLFKELGYYNANVNILVENKKDNLVDLNFDFKIGKKFKIKKITFVGNKIFKDSKLKRIIASSEFKYWKFLTGRKYLNENLVEFDKKLLSNFYKNNGYYNVVINSSFAKLINENEFELIFNIEANPKIYFGNLNLILPLDFEKNNFQKIFNLFDEIKGKSYSINIIDRILKQIDSITTLEQYKFINATVDEEIKDDKINLKFIIEETEKYYVDKINIFGNTITSENVIRNQLEVDEGDPFNDILINKSINNIQSLNFFKKVENEIIENNNKTKTINISVEEKPTGEISAQAGIGTDGTSVGFGIKENNFLGKGIGLDSNFTLSSDSLRVNLLYQILILEIQISQYLFLLKQLR